VQRVVKCVIRVQPHITDLEGQHQKAVVRQQQQELLLCAMLLFLKPEHLALNTCVTKRQRHQDPQELLVFPENLEVELVQVVIWEELNGVLLEHTNLKQDFLNVRTDLSKQATGNSAAKDTHQDKSIYGRQFFTTTKS
jgi:hypothetical protein